MNDFDDLLAKLNDGRLTHNNIQIAYRAWKRKSENIPDGIKDLLCGKEGHTSLLFDVFTLMGEIVGKMELAYRRGYAEGSAAYKKGTKP